jgi:prepilin-type N-terminal cleavage/methylation domain-containing protein
MNLAPSPKKQTGFTLIELMVSVTIFTILSAAMFGLLNLSQERNRVESQFLDTFQEARLGLDQIVREASDSGFPPANHFSVLPAVGNYAQSPVAWSPAYPITVCAASVTCATPGPFDVIFEEDYDGTGVVRWIRYQLQGTTLMRGVTPKVAGDPDAPTLAVLAPYILNVMNNAPAAQIAAIQVNYPAMFPGGAAVPIFTYITDPPLGAAGCIAALASPCNIRDVGVTLIVQSPQRDTTNQQLRLVELNGRGRRSNPNK